MRGPSRDMGDKRREVQITPGNRASSWRQRIWCCYSLQSNWDALGSRARAPSEGAGLLLARTAPLCGLQTGPLCAQGAQLGSSSFSGCNLRAA